MTGAAVTADSARYHSPNLGIRRLRNQIAMGIICLFTLMAIAPLFLVFIYVIKEGFSAINWDFFTQLPAPTGQTGGGMGNAVVGSLLLVGMASVIAIPAGIMGGMFLSELDNGSVAKLFRWAIDLLASLPSIVVGLYVYAVVVAPMKSFSAHAGAAALAILMLPIVVKTTEEVLKLMPQSLRDAGFALGISRWRVIVSIVLQGRLSAVATGVVLALARVAGETAPLLITAFGNRNWPQALDQPTPSLPVQIYNYAISPYDDWHHQAWAGALTLVMLIFIINFTVRILFTRNER